MTKPGLILIGAGGHAHACIDVVEEQGYFQIAGLVGLPSQRRDKLMGYAVIGDDSELSELAKTYQYALVATGQILTAKHRTRLFQRCMDAGFELPIIIAPTAHVSKHARLGKGCIVMHGATINAGATVGSNCIVNTHSLLEHDVIVRDHCHISTGAIVNGGVIIDSGTFIGSACVIKERVEIGKGCVVGMGLSVRHNLSDHSHFLGRADT
jgi:sugar O-acyltransferase (sialic acid O-acetyltransferase NeuD family)